VTFVSNRLGLVAILAAAFFGSFFATLWMTAIDGPFGVTPPSADGRSVADRLAGSRIASEADLVRTAKELSLSRSTRLKGFVDAISRVSEADVRVVGWLADTAGDGSPQSLTVFVGGALAATAWTSGERADVTEILHLGFGAEKNVGLVLDFHCRPNERPVIVGLNGNGNYFPLNTKPCP
jgi:hypothetical protein